MINDTDKLNAAVDAMAACMGKVLSLKDNEIAKGRMTLGQVLYQERSTFNARPIGRDRKHQQGPTVCRKCTRTRDQTVHGDQNTGNVVLTSTARSQRL